MKVSPKQYAKLLYSQTEGLEGANLDAAIKGIVEIVRKNRDQGKMEKIVSEFNRVYKEKEGVLEGEIVSVKPLDETKIKSIEKIMAEKYKILAENIKLVNRVDGAIKGGLIIKLNGDVWDGSLKSKIERLKSRIAN